MTYDAIVTTKEGKHTYQNIEALNEQHLINKIAKDLQTELVEIEIEKPVIPQFVADWIEQLYGQGFDSDDLLEILFSRNYDIAELRIFDWFTNDKERAIVAILYGYEIEQEPSYYAKIKGGN